MRRAAQDPRARVFVLFLDPRHVDLKGSMQVRRPMIDALNTLIGGDDLIAVMTPEMSAARPDLYAADWQHRGDAHPALGTGRLAGTKDLVEAQYEAATTRPSSTVRRWRRR